MKLGYSYRSVTNTSSNLIGSGGKVYWASGLKSEICRASRSGDSPEMHVPMRFLIPILIPTLILTLVFPMAFAAELLGRIMDSMNNRIMPDEFDNWEATYPGKTISQVPTKEVKLAYLFKIGQCNKALDLLEEMEVEAATNTTIQGSVDFFKQGLDEVCLVTPSTVTEDKFTELGFTAWRDRLISRPISGYDLREVELALAMNPDSTDDTELKWYVSEGEGLSRASQKATRIRLLWQKAYLMADLDPTATLETIQESLNLMTDSTGAFIAVEGVPKVPAGIMLRMTNLKVSDVEAENVANAILKMGTIADPTDLLMAQAKAGGDVKKKMKEALLSATGEGLAFNPYDVYKAQKDVDVSAAMNMLLSAYRSGSPHFAQHEEDFVFVMRNGPGLDAGNPDPMTWSFPRDIKELSYLWSALSHGKIVEIWKELEPSMTRKLYGPLKVLGSDVAPILVAVREVLMTQMEDSANANDPIDTYLDVLKAAIESWDLEAIPNTELSKFRKYIDHALKDSAIVPGQVEDLKTLVTDNGGVNLLPRLHLLASEINHKPMFGNAYENLKEILNFLPPTINNGPHLTIIKSINPKVSDRL